MSADKRHVEEIDLSEEQEQALDRAWDKLDQEPPPPAPKDTQAK